MHYGDVLIKFGECTDVARENIPYISDDKVADKYISSRIQDGDIVFADTAEDATVGKCSEFFNIQKQPIISGLHTIPCHPLFSFSRCYLGYFLNSPAYHNQLLPLMQGTKVVGISKTAIKDTNISFPEDTEEQQAIGNYFQNIDRLINTSQTKLDELKNIKKACLEKMFPRNGSTTPELRFKGFSEEWEICELKDICVIKTGYPFNSMDFSDDGDFRVITNGNIQDNSAIVDNLSGNKVNIYNKQIIEEYGLNIGDVLVTMDGTVGRSAKVAGDYMILAQRVGRLIAVNNTEFLYQLLNASSFYKEMTAISVGGTIKHISLSDIGSYSTPIPTDVNEQIQLGIFFRNLDDLIAKTEQRINKLKNIKKACLDKMFVNRED